MTDNKVYNPPTQYNQDYTKGKPKSGIVKLVIDLMCSIINRH